MTLVSRPVLGQASAGQCATPSASLSMPTSQHGEPQVCLGRTPGFWKQSQKFPEWPSPPYYPVVTGPYQATRFNQVFNPTPYPSATTFLQVLEMGGGPPNDLARHIVASALNIAKGWVPVLTLSQIQGMWLQYMNTGGGGLGYFEPTAGVKWYHDDIVNYLTSTMTL